MVQKACVWATHHSSTKSGHNDLLLIKERILSDDGVITSNLKCIENYKRSYWVTKPAFRDHKQKRIHEAMEHMDRYECTQAELARHIFKVTHGYDKSGFIRLTEACESPYVYGADVTTPVLAKAQYLAKWPDFKPLSTVAVADYETDMINSRPEDKVIITGAITMKDKWVVVCRRDFLDGVNDVEVQFERLLDKYLAKYKKERGASVEFILVDSEIDVVKHLMMKAHEWKPDYLAFWNVAFDIEAMTNACSRAGVAPEYIFCDPSIPQEYRKFKFVKDQQIKKKATGETTSKDLMDLWHRVEAPASFYIVCAMAFFRLNRVMSQAKRTSYALEEVAYDTIGVGKLKLTDADNLGGSEWHVEMQSRFKLFYLMYNIFDCVVVEMLDEKTNDLAIALTTYCGISEIKSANSNPKRLADAGHFFLLDENRVICSTSGDMTDPLDRLLMSRRGWIITLAAERVTETGRTLVYGVPDCLSRISAHCGDIDVESSYPTTGSVLNTSSSTTRFEIYAVEGLSELEQRTCSINMTAIPTNAIELGAKLYGLPSLIELKEIFIEHTTLPLE